MTMMWIGIGMTVVGAGISAYGSYSQGKAAEKASEFKAKEIENQRINDQLETREEIRRQRVANRKFLAGQQVAAVKSGFAADAGSPLLLMAESAMNLELQIQDASRAQEGRSRAATGRRRLSIFEGQAAKQAGTLGAYGEAISGIGRAGSIYAGGMK